MNTEYQEAAQRETELPVDELVARSDEETLNSQRVLIKAALERYLERGGVEKADWDQLDKFLELITSA